MSNDQYDAVYPLLHCDQGFKAWTAIPIQRSTNTMTTGTGTSERETLRVSFEVDKEDFKTARQIMTKLTKEDDPAIRLPLSDEQVAFSIYLYGFDAYMESYGDDDDPPHSADCPRAVISSAECMCPAENAARYRDDN